jgi:hypothetical protein
MELLVFENYTLQKERLVKFIFKINVIAEKIQILEFVQLHETYRK